MKLKHQQILKFISLVILSIVGITWYVVDGGSLLKAVLLYTIFGLVKVVAMIAYHRWMAHNHIQPAAVGKFILLYCVVCGALVKPLHYVIGHRLHHRSPDTDRDPHPPSIGFWNMLIGNFNEPPLTVKVSDILRRSEIMFVNKHFYTLYFANLVLWWLIDPQVVMLSFALLNLRQLFSATMFNYLTHGGGGQLGARNLPWYTSYLLGWFGEHFHKNHHDDPSNPNLGYESWYNSDWSYQVLTRFTSTRQL
jgi:stearoyl-CoA desaturase (delta-9 desaturase)